MTDLYYMDTGIASNSWQHELTELLVDFLEAGASNEGISLDMSIRFGSKFRHSTDISVHSFLGPFNRGVLIVHRNAGLAASQLEDESSSQTQIKFAVGDSEESGQTFVSSLLDALKGERRLQSMRLDLRVRDWQNGTESLIQLKFKNGTLRISSIQSRTAGLRWASPGPEAKCKAELEA